MWATRIAQNGQPATRATRRVSDSTTCSQLTVGMAPAILEFTSDNMIVVKVDRAWHLSPNSRQKQ